MGISDYPDIPSLQKRFKDIGFTTVEVYDMYTMYNVHLNQEERRRLN